jgi:hypothetical protein
MIFRTYGNGRYWTTVQQLLLFRKVTKKEKAESFGNRVQLLSIARKWRRILSLVSRDSRHTKQRRQLPRNTATFGAPANHQTSMQRYRLRSR